MDKRRFSLMELLLKDDGKTMLEKENALANAVWVSSKNPDKEDLHFPYSEAVNMSKKDIVKKANSMIGVALIFGDIREARVDYEKKKYDKLQSNFKTLQSNFKTLQKELKECRKTRQKELKECRKTRQKELKECRKTKKRKGDVWETNTTEDEINHKKYIFNMCRGLRKHIPPLHDMTDTGIVECL